MVTSERRGTRREGPQVAPSRWGNITTGAVLLVVAVTALVQSAGIGEASRATDPGPGGYPSLLAVLLIGLAALLMIQRTNNEESPSLKSALKVIGAVALLVGYALLQRQIGYLVSTALFLAGNMLLMRARPLWRVALVAVAVSIGLYVLFYLVLGVSLPRGNLERMIA